MKKFLVACLFITNVCSAEEKKPFNSFQATKKALEKIYNDNPDSRKTFYCGCSFDENKNIGSCPEPIKLSDEKRSKRLEWEHVVPASQLGKYFNKNIICETEKSKGRACLIKKSSKFREMHNDLYNLQPEVGKINALRSDKQYAIIRTENLIMGCDFEVMGDYVEPRKEIRGDIARTYFYMRGEYPEYVRLKRSFVEMLRLWTVEDPVSDEECFRAKKIFAIQGNKNPFLWICY